MTTPSLIADCARCAALCCVAPAFDRSDDFAIDKPACTPCLHLGANNDCRIYGRREAEGFRGCAVFDCQGAGQRVIQEVFHGRSWRDEPDLLPAMARAYAAMCEIHRLLALLQAIAAKCLSESERGALEELSAALTPSSPWTSETLATFEESDLPQRVRRFLRSLKHHFAKS